MGVAAAADDAEAEYLQQACERELIVVLESRLGCGVGKWYFTKMG